MPCNCCARRRTAAAPWLRAGAALLALVAAADGPAARPAAAAPPIPKDTLADPQTLVLRGKLPAFYDPADLSKPPVLSAASALVMDAATGQILWEKNGAARRAPASTTKILTALLLIEHTRPADVITVMDPSVTKIEESSLHLKPWEKLSAQDLLYGLMLRSANDGAVVAAQTVAGSVPKFAEMMNARARELGAVDSNFRNPHGLTENGHYTTARDMAVIARAALADPRFVDAVSIPRRTITRSKQTKDVRLVAKSRKFFEKFPGADGIKTGYTRVAGHCFVGSATRDGRRLISVVLGAKNSATGDTIPLLSWAFQRFPAHQVARKGAPVGVVAVRGGTAPSVSVTAGADLHVSADRFGASAAVQSELQGDPVVAPIAAGQEVGRLAAKVGGEAISSVPVLAATDVAPSPWPRRPAAPAGACCSSAAGRSSLSSGSPMEQRLQKALAAAGVASRRHAEQLIASGRVAVDGKVVTVPGTKVDPDAQAITVDGAPMAAAPAKRHYVALHKPIGYVSTTRDRHAPRKVTDLVDLPASGSSRSAGSTPTPKG
jgi:D-alanyl-D-alanine carboxypeptidase (penicillin-binding protein 5/6)